MTPEGKRTESSFKPIDLAMNLCLHTLTLTSNENIFKPAMYYKITIDIERTAKAIYYTAWEANGVNMRGSRETIAENWKVRKELEAKAIRLCGQLTAEITLAKRKFHLRNNKFDYWVGLIKETKASLIAWKESDTKRYG